MSSKFPRTPHLPWSPGGTRDDRRMLDVGGLLGTELVVTEKLDGSNLCLSRESVFARSHSGPPAHASFSMAKQLHAEVSLFLPEGVDLFGEYCYAIHSIQYKSLPSVFFTFMSRGADGLWLSWDDTQFLCRSVGLATVPELWRGSVKSEDELKKVCDEFMLNQSTFGGDREGLVVRDARSFTGDEFVRKIAKWVRADHVQTDEHWASQKIVPQKIETVGR